MKKLIPSREDLQAANKNPISTSDYFDYIINISSSPRDISLVSYEIFFPTFMPIDGLVFNISFGCYERFLDNIRIGLSYKESHYWSHIVNVTEMFKLSELESINFGNKMVDGWNLMLNELNMMTTKFHLQLDVFDGVIIAPNID